MKKKLILLVSLLILLTISGVSCKGCDGEDSGSYKEKSKQEINEMLKENKGALKYKPITEID